MENPKARRRVSYGLLLLSATAWLLMWAFPSLMTGHAGHGAPIPSAESTVIGGPPHTGMHGHSDVNGHTGVHGHTGMHGHGDMPAQAAIHPVGLWAAGWALMLVAMMLPTLIAPILHILDRSFKRRQTRSVLLFVVGYVAIWMPVGVVLTVAVLLIGRFAPTSSVPWFLPALGVGLIAFVWQCSPTKQRCLNRNHNHHELAAFGRKADIDALRFGLSHGWWCVGSCWALMTLPMMMSTGHFITMAAVTFLMISERLAPPRPLDWRLRFPGNLARVLIVRGRMLLQRLRPDEGLASMGLGEMKQP